MSKDIKSYISEVYKVEAEKYNKTRDIQWKLNLAIWSLFILGISTKEKLLLNIIMAITIATLLCVVHVFFVMQIHQSLDKSLHRMKNMARFMIEGGDESITWAEIEKETADIDHFWKTLQIGITIILALTFAASRAIH